MWVSGPSSYGNCSGSNMLEHLLFGFHRNCLNVLIYGIIDILINFGNLVLSYKFFTLQERLEREYNLSLITTAPSVVYRVNCVNGDTVISSHS